MKHQGDIRVADTSGSSCLQYKTPASRLIPDKPGANHLQRHRTSQIDIDRLVGHSHRTVTQLKGRSILSGEDLVVVESGRRRGVDRVNIQFTGLTRVAQNASERAHRTKVAANGNSRATSLAG